MKTNKYSIKYLLISLLAIIFIQKGYAQRKDSVLNARNTFYIGLANEGAIYSINYDRVFSSQKKFALTYSLGFSILKNAIALPIGINLLTGKRNAHAEIGFSLIPYLYKYQSFLSNNDLSDKQIYLVPSIGYRFQKPNGGFFFRGFVSPSIFLDPPSSNFWKMDPKLRFMVSCGLGYNF